MVAETTMSLARCIEQALQRAGYMGTEDYIEPLIAVATTPGADLAPLLRFLGLLPTSVAEYKQCCRYNRDRDGQFDITDEMTQVIRPFLEDTHTYHALEVRAMCDLVYPYLSPWEREVVETGAVSYAKRTHRSLYGIWRFIYKERKGLRARASELYDIYVEYPHTHPAYGFPALTTILGQGWAPTDVDVWSIAEFRNSVSVPLYADDTLIRRARIEVRILETALAT